MIRRKVMDKLRGIGVTTTEKLGELLLTVSVADRVHIASLTTGMDPAEVARRLHELAEEIEARST
jgi:hypothetical protein